jgi:hypothetical protein
MARSSPLARDRSFIALPAGSQPVRHIREVADGRTAGCQIFWPVRRVERLDDKPWGIDPPWSGLSGPGERNT